MIPASMLRPVDSNHRISRRDAELRTYLASEWKMGLPAFLAQLRREERPSRLRIRRGWLRGRARASARTTAAADGGQADHGAPGRTVPPESCDHPAAEPLGLGGTAQFLRCLLCGAVLVTVQGRRFSVPPETEGAPEAEC